MRLVVVVSLLLVACGKGDKPPPPSSGGLLAQETGPSHSQGGGNTRAPIRHDNTPSDPLTLYKHQCAMCHGATGRGDGVSAGALRVKPRDYTDPKWQASITDVQIKKIIVLGGAAVGKNDGMPPSPNLANKPELVDGLVKIIRGFAKK